MAQLSDGFLPVGGNGVGLRELKLTGLTTGVKPCAVAAQHAPNFMNKQLRLKRGEAEVHISEYFREKSNG